MELQFGRLVMQVINLKVHAIQHLTSLFSLSHTGHDDNFQTVATPSLSGNEMMYDLEGQIRHKIEFIERFVPKHVTVILIGYSVGARMSLELLDHPKFSDKISQCYLLFPAIERFAESAAGRNFPRIDKFFFIARFFSSIFHQFPMFIRRPFVRFALRFVGIDDDEFEDSLLQITCPVSVDKLWYLAMDSFYNIKELKDEIVESNLHRLKIYYGARDEFVRKKFYYNLIEKFPQINAELCTRNFPHMFMLKNSIEMAEMVCEWIKEKQ